MSSDELGVVVEDFISSIDILFFLWNRLGFLQGQPCCCRQSFINFIFLNRVD